MTFVPTAATQVYTTANPSLVQVQTAMSGTGGSQVGKTCDNLQTCNGITITTTIPNAKFVQFFYREGFAQGTAVHLRYPTTDCTLKDFPQSCYDLTVIRENPTANWIPDAARPPSPFYTAQDVLINGNNPPSLFDTPTFYGAMQVPDETVPALLRPLTSDVTVDQWVFHGRDFIVSGNQVVATVEWTLTHQASAAKSYAGMYTNVSVATACSKLPQTFVDVLNSYTQPKNGFSFTQPTP